ncbi:MAG: 4Fe-4S dicluster domain-containing protein [Firmicutes bacterium]|nr:4Fe-4S dicluster domain-containing protein [Bacillota bacterium]
MKYRSFGNTNKKISSLGFGCMRLPKLNNDDMKSKLNEEKSIELLKRAYKLGINYFDTAPFYCNGQSEEMVGKAVKPFRDKIYLSTKNPIEDGSIKTFRKYLNQSLKRLDTDYIDFYHMWGINLKEYIEKIDKKNGPLYEAFKAKEEGLIKHLSFSFHDASENLFKLIDTGHFETMLVQYNLLDRRNEEGIKYAMEKGLGVAIMGPIAGGRLGKPSKVIQNILPNKIYGSNELALKFVLANTNVTTALSGMENIKMLEENVNIADNSGYLSDKEVENVKKAMEEKKSLANLYCTACKYCMPCPENVNIAKIFKLMNYYRIYDIKNYAKKEYKKLDGSNKKGSKAEACIECGECESKCPQNIKIVSQLKECSKALS